MKVLFLNYAYDEDLRTPSELIERYHVIHEWCDAVRRAGAERVSVVQRYAQSTQLRLDGIDYFFIDDGMGPKLKWLQDPVDVHEFAARLASDAVHLNGTIHFANSLRSVLKPGVAILWQSHSNGSPGWRSRWLWKKRCRHIDGLLLTSAAQAEPLRKAGLISNQHDIYEVPVASSTFQPLPHREWRVTLGMHEQTVFLWVGRLNANKDPLTILQGFREIVRHDGHAHLYMIYNESDLFEEVQRTITKLALVDRVHLLGFIEHEKLPAYYSAADFFVLGSHYEVCGFAVIEAISCGAAPIVTDIPSFRKITRNGSIGFLWQSNNAAAFAHAVKMALKHRPRRETIQSFFAENLSYEVLGAKALKIYKQASIKRQSVILEKTN